MHASERGYSLIELMVVVAIIGIFSLVTIPAMTNFSRMNKVRAAVRELNSDLRAVRTLAITQSAPMTITMYTGQDPTDKDLRARYDLPDAVRANRRVKRLDDIVYFVGPENGTITITFLPNGTVQGMVGTTTRTIQLSSEHELPNDDVTITFSPSGSFKTVAQ
ncbi:MAG TPA: GspH/FimT family pseudopilin [Thermoanaerobaculia bacterium]|nr:GspH/FimT family pseudopilin [Thermoanaerobaculia bacterium]